jgi:4'-phosphopantetheinyl transferase
MGLRDQKGQMIAGCSFELSGRGVHVWTLRTGASDAVAANFEPVLAPDEKDRAARFRFDRLRHSFVIRRGALRYLLGRYLDRHPASIRFNYGSKGKPAVASAVGIEFNTTHSGGLSVFAFTVGCQIGVDLEQIRLLTETQHIADRFFCSEEAAEIMSLPPSERERAFFYCWTRKEAYVKAIGDGLSAPLDEFRVTLQPNQPARFIHLAHDMKAAKAWTLHDLRLASDYAAALAYRDRQRSLSVFPIVGPVEFISIP